MTRITLTLPEPPSANVYWRSFKGRVVKSKEARDYQTAVHLLAAQHVKRGMFPFPAGTPVRVTLDWFRGRRAGDLDNRIKVCLDALSRAVYADDDQIVEIVARRHDAPKQGRLDVTISAA